MPTHYMLPPAQGAPVVGQGPGSLEQLLALIQSLGMGGGGGMAQPQAPQPLNPFANVGEILGGVQGIFGGNSVMERGVELRNHIFPDLAPPVDPIAAAAAAPAPEGPMRDPQGGGVGPGNFVGNVPHYGSWGEFAQKMGRVLSGQPGSLGVNPGAGLGYRTAAQRANINRGGMQTGGGGGGGPSRDFNRGAPAGTRNAPERRI